MTIKRQTRPQEQRKPFSTEDLQKIFNTKQYLDDRFKHSFQFWLPILGLFTGMRLEEICQLHLEDIRIVQDIWVFDLFEKREDKRKTEAGQRYVPLHHFLKDDLNLPGRVQYLTNAGETRLFPELKKNKYGQYSHYAGRWFNEFYKKKCQFTDPEDKVFHSFRGSITSFLQTSLPAPWSHILQRRHRMCR